MILTCPACATSYFVSDEAIGPNGRRVRCKSCGHDWRASLEDEPLELSPQSQNPDLSGEAAASSGDETDQSTGDLADRPAPELPRAFRAKAEQKRRMRQAATQGAAWVAAIVVVTALILAGLAYRLPIVQAWPQTASLYKAIGFPVNLTGVEPEALRGKVLIHDPGRVVVGGALRNIRDNEVVPPPVIIILRDERGALVSRKQISLDGPPILPGKVQGFAAILDNPGGKGTRIAVEFPMTSTKVEPETKTPAKSAVVHRPLPVAEEGLRSASAFDQTPKDAAPLDKKAH